MGKIMQAWRNWKSIPKVDNNSRKKCAIFEQKLSNYVNRTLRLSFKPFLKNFEDGQSKKKQAVIQLINTTMSGQKKMYNRWHALKEKTKQMNECRLVHSLFQSLNNTIKAVVDNAFIENKDTQIKEKALLQLFKNLQGNMGECFKRWREANKEFCIR